MPAKDRANLVSRQRSVSCGCRRVGKCNSKTVCVRIVSNDEVRADRTSLLEAQVKCSSFFRIGEGDGREARVGLKLLFDQRRRRKTGGFEDLEKDIPPTPCIGV